MPSALIRCMRPGPWVKNVLVFAQLIFAQQALQTGAAGRTLVPFSRAEARAATPPPNLDVLALEFALERLAALDERQARLVELRVYGGLTIGSRRRSSRSRPRP